MHHGAPRLTRSAGPLLIQPMCNLYSITTNQAAIIGLFRVINRYVGNLLPMPGVLRETRTIRSVLCCLRPTTER